MELQDLLSLNVIVLIAVINFIVLFLRKMLERNKVIKSSFVWREYILVLLPSLIGLIIVTYTSYPVPDLFISKISKAFFGIFAGLISNNAYSIIKKQYSKIQLMNSK